MIAILQWAYNDLSPHFVTDPVSSAFGHTHTPVQSPEPLFVLLYDTCAWLLARAPAATRWTATSILRRPLAPGVPRGRIELAEALLTSDLHPASKQG